MAWADPNCSEVASVCRQYARHAAALGHGRDDAIDQTELQLAELDVELQSTNQIAGRELQLVRRGRIGDFANQSPHRRSLGAKEIVHLGQYQSRHDDRRRMGERVLEVGPGRATIGATRQRAQPPARVRHYRIRAWYRPT
ncbi:MAG TPA: hypothetical protein VLW85_05020 [Myxococcales bacterium]|nr:hypothetical protein [Myxococcales bacterium]